VAQRSRRNTFDPSRRERQAHRRREPLAPGPIATAAAHAVALDAGATISTLNGAPIRYEGPTVRNPPFVCSCVPNALWAAAAARVAVAASEQA
jgi:hypothetical protein